MNIFKGHGHAFGAISVINALATGTGAAIGLKDLFTDVIINLKENKPLLAPSHAVQIAIKKTLTYIGEQKPLGGIVTVGSNIPIAFGLKSSSAVINAAVLATVNAANVQLSVKQILDISTSAAIQAKISVTGALDDATASLLGGFCITNNTQNLVLLHQPVPFEIIVLIFIPGKFKARKTVNFYEEITNFQQNALEMQEIIKKAKTDFLTAMTQNGFLVARSFEYDTTPMDIALKNKALAASVSGTGPAIVALCHKKDEPNIIKAWDGLDPSLILKSRVSCIRLL
ncbi:MAG: shikimate kinase [Candidatus Hodarchaeota archaeon]